nr:tetratricopeptide repeat protein [Pyrinomonadaceae bacterium]
MQDRIAPVKSFIADPRLSRLVLPALALTLFLFGISSARAQTDQMGQTPDLSASDTSAVNSTPARPRRHAAQTLGARKRGASAKRTARTAKTGEAELKALSEMINRYIQEGRQSQAHRRLDQLIAANPHSAPLHYLKAQVYGFEKKEQEAEAELRRTLEIEPNYLPAYFSLGSLYTNTNEPDRAIAEFREIIRRRPNDATAYTLIGMLEYKRNNIDEAVKNYRQALDVDPKAAIAANNLASLYADHDKGDLDEAMRLAQDVVLRHPNQPGILDTLGWVYYKKGLYEQSVEQLRKAIAMDGGNPVFRYHLGMALAAKGDQEESRRELQIAALLDKNKVLAKMESTNEKGPKVKVNLEEPAPILPPAAKEGDRVGELREEVESAKDDERARVRRTLVDELIKQDRKKEAVDELRIMAREERFDPIGFYNTGNALARLGDTDTAIDAYRKAISQRQGSYARAHNNLGVVLLRQGRWDDAYQSLISALKLESFRYSEASYNLGRLYSMRGEVDLAIREWERALKVQPDHQDAAIALARAYAADGNPSRAVVVLDALVARTGPSSEVTLARREVLFTDTETDAGAASAKSPTSSKPRVMRVSTGSPRDDERVASRSAPRLVAASPSRPVSVDPETYVLLQRARESREQGRYEDAVKDYNRVLARLGGFFAPANLEMSFALINLKRDDEALATLQALTTKAGARYPIAYYHLGRLYELRGQTGLAAENFQRAAAAYGEINPQFLLDVSRVREKEGNVGAALEAMEAYVRATERLGGKHDWADARLAELRKKVALSTTKN